MVAQNIIDKILQDAKALEAQILQDAKQKCLDLTNAHQEKLKEKEKAYKEKCLLKVKNYKTSLDISLNLEKNKQVLKAKNDVIKNLKEEVFTLFCELIKKDKLDFLKRKLEKNCQIGDTLFVKLKGTTLKEISSLAFIKSQKIVVKSLDEEGFILSHKNYDLSYTIKEEIDETFEKLKRELLEKLF